MKYVKYFLYILQHKFYVLIECWKVGLIWQGVIHDLSKFRPSEFFPYIDIFSGVRSERSSVAVKVHYSRNPHHWNGWVTSDSAMSPVNMPDKYIIEMVCDWRAMSRKFGGSAAEFYNRKRGEIQLTEQTRTRVEEELRKEG